MLLTINWQKNGIEGLYDKPRKGTTPKINEKDLEKIKEIIEDSLLPFSISATTTEGSAISSGSTNFKCNIKFVFS